MAGLQGLLPAAEFASRRANRDRASFLSERNRLLTISENALRRKEARDARKSAARKKKNQRNRQTIGAVAGAALGGLATPAGAALGTTIKAASLGASLGGAIAGGDSSDIASGLENVGKFADEQGLPTFGEILDNSERIQRQIDQSNPNVRQIDQSNPNVSPPAFSQESQDEIINAGTRDDFSFKLSP